MCRVDCAMRRAKRITSGPRISQRRASLKLDRRTRIRRRPAAVPLERPEVCQLDRRGVAVEEDEVDSAIVTVETDAAHGFGAVLLSRQGGIRRVEVGRVLLV